MRSAHVIPLLRLPRRLHIFDYSIPEELEGLLDVGHLVSIPFRKKIIMGVVKSIDDSEIKNLKPILSIRVEEPIFPKSHFALLEWMASTYGVSMGTLALLTLPSFPKRKKSVFPTFQPAMVSAHHEPITAFIPEILQAKKPVILLTPTLSIISDILTECMREAADKGTQCLLLCPTIQDVIDYSDDLGHDTPLPLIPYHTDLPAPAARTALLAASGGVPCCIIGTRSAVLLPFAKLDTILIENSHSREHKQYDQNPRYDARDCAYERARQTQCRLILCSPAPRLEDYARVQGGHTEFFSPPAPPPTQVIDLSNELKKGNPPFVSDALLTASTYSLERGKGVFLFLNRKGTSRLVRCNSCEFTFSCHACAIPLSYHERTKELICRSCQKKSRLPSECPQCHGVSFGFKGIGIEKYAAFFRTVYPDREVIEITKEEGDLVIDSARIADSIVVGTSAFPYHFARLFSSIGLVCVVSADPLLSLTDFRSTEQSWQTCAHLLALARAKGCATLLQTFRPEEHFIKTLAFQDYQSFAAKELAERSRFSWPPFVHLIRIIPKEKTDLKTLADTLPQSIGIKTSFDEQGLLLRIALPVEMPLPATLAEWLTTLPDTLLIDRDPFFG